MLHYEKSGDPRATLLDVIRQVRKRWRVKLAVRGTVGFLAATAVALIGSAYALEALRFSPGSILAFRIVLILAALASAGWFLVRPLLRKVDDEQVALYLEEHEPTLEATIITAMEAERAGRAQDASPALIRRLVEAAVERAQRLATITLRGPLGASRTLRVADDVKLDGIKPGDSVTVAHTQALATHMISTPQPVSDPAPAP